MAKIVICKLRNYMDTKNINIAQLSREIEVTENAIRGYAKNSFSRIDNIVATKICTYFDVSLGEMFEIQEVNK